MRQCNGVYLHGFLSSGNSQKGQWFKRQLQDVSLFTHSNLSCRLMTPTYPMQNPTQSIDYLTNYLYETGLPDSKQPWFLMGSSMGGFYAQYLAQQFRVPYIMINPALDPSSLFNDYLGEHRNPHTDELILIDQSYRNALSAYYAEPVPDIESLLLLDKGDEVIPYQQALDTYRTGDKKHRTIVFENGSHAFEHCQEAMSDVIEFINQAVLKEG